MNERIKEMTKTIGDTWVFDLEGNPHDLSEVLMQCDIQNISEQLYEAGYRKRIKGEWKRIDIAGENYAQIYYQHKDCKVNETQIFPSPYHFCPNCGASMKGGAE